MIYLLHDNAGDKKLVLKGEVHKYLIKVLRHSLHDKISMRAMQSISLLHTYEITDITPKTLSLTLLTSQEKIVKSQKELHLAWCVIDVKSIEKVLPSLNEIGISKISFIYCDRSQKNFKLDFKRFNRLLEASMQQCGRTEIMEFDTYKNISSFISKFPDTKVFDFSDNILDGEVRFQRVLIGCEGGFSKEERKFFKPQDVFRLNSPMVLRSESAAVAVASKILL